MPRLVTNFLLSFLTFLHCVYCFPPISVPLQRYVGYNFNISVGQPGQRMFVEFDTGFQYLVLPGPSHPGCGLPSFPCYDEANSITALIPSCEQLPTELCNQTFCSINGSASECVPSVNSQLFDDGGEWRWRSDIVSLSPMSTARIFFLVWLSTPEVYPVHFGGDFGFAWPGLRVPPLPAKTSFVASLHDQNTTSSAILAVTLSEQGGELAFGGIAPKYTEWLPLVSTQLGNYLVTASKVTVNSISLLSNHSQTPLWTGPDTGTLSVAVPRSVAKAFHHYLLTDYCEHGVTLVGVCNLTAHQHSLFDGACFAMTPAAIAEFPSLHFAITPWQNSSQVDQQASVELVWHSELYLSNNTVATMFHNCTAGDYALMITRAEHNDIVLGSPILQNYVTVFDYTSMQLGWRRQH